MNLSPEYRFPSLIWVIMHGFGSFCLDLSHVALIWAISQKRPKRRISPRDGVGGEMDVCADVQRDSNIQILIYRF